MGTSSRGQQGGQSSALHTHTGGDKWLNTSWMTKGKSSFWTKSWTKYPDWKSFLGERSRIFASSSGFSAGTVRSQGGKPRTGSPPHRTQGKKACDVHLRGAATARHHQTSRDAQRAAALQSPGQHPACLPGFPSHGHETRAHRQITFFFLFRSTGNTLPENQKLVKSDSSKES